MALTVCLVPGPGGDRRQPDSLLSDGRQPPAPPAEKPLPFLVIRLWPKHHTDPALLEELLAALRRQRACCDEVWLCTEIGFPTLQRHAGAGRGDGPRPARRFSESRGPRHDSIQPVTKVLEWRLWAISHSGHKPSFWRQSVCAFWDGIRLWSRLGNRIFAPAWFTAGLPLEPLDGELWLGRKMFQRTMSIVRRQNESDLWKEVRFVIFDAPANDEEFGVRLRVVLVMEVNHPPYAVALPHYLCRGREHLQAELTAITDATILIDHLKAIYIEAVLEIVETGAYFPKIRRKDFVIALNLQTSGPDPDPVLDIFYGCGSSLNWDGYCDPELDKLIELQSIEADMARRRAIVWQIERKLAQDAVRPIIFYAHDATCWRPYVKGVTILVNSFFNGYRYEDVWLDK